MRKVSKEKVSRLKEKLREEFEDFEVLYKDEYDQWPNHWTLTIMKLFVSIVGFFFPGWKKEFNGRVVNGVGPFLVFPNREEYSDWRERRVYETVRHEYVHMKDFQRNPYLFPLTYIFLPLPMLFSGRAHWEIRGFVQNMIVEYELDGRVRLSTIHWIANQFPSGLYFFMFPFRGVIMEKLKRIREKIEDGEIEGFYPSVGLFS